MLSTSSAERKNDASISSTNKKPKRPLSGYNLFYRYKRVKVLEATAHLNNDNHPAVDNDARSKEIIHKVITSLPGSEGIPPNHALWTSFPTHAINELRGNNIRTSMEGKLFPNENARSRLHRKVHGMGFVEMGKIMREMWACIDIFTKDIFCELADVGRVRYRVLLAEFKAREVGNVVSSVENARLPVKKRNNKNKRAQSLTVATSTSASAMISIEEVTPKPAKKPNVRAFITPVASIKVQANFARPLSVGNNMNPHGYGSHASGRPTLEPLSLSVATKDFVPPKTSSPRFERRVSTDLLDLGLDGSAPSASSTRAPTPSSVNSNAIYQKVFRNDFQSLLMKNSLPPPPMFHQLLAPVPQVSMSHGNINAGGISSGGGTTCRDIITPGSASPTNNQDGVSDDEERQAEVCAQDFIKLIDMMDDTIDKDQPTPTGMDSVMTWASGQGNGRRPSMIFGKPMHDVQMHPMPCLDTCELNNARARMA